MRKLCESLGLAPADLHIYIGKWRIRAFSPLWYILNALAIAFGAFSFWAWAVIMIILFG